MDKKKVSVIVPCRNESLHIKKCVEHICSFDPPPGGFEVIVVDGMSNDGTRDILPALREEYPDLILIDNPEKTVPHAMNLGIHRATGEYIVRTDVRCIHPKSYLKDLISLSEETGGDNVGGTLEAAGSTYVQESIAAAYKSPLAAGRALGNRGILTREVDTVYGGCFRRELLLKVGMYDEEMTRNQDDELSFRIRKYGGRILQSGDIRIKYFPRKHYHQLFKQFLQYGYWKVPVIKRHPKQASWRHVMPSLFIFGLLGLGIASFFSDIAFRGFLLYCGIYLLSLSLEGLRITLPDNARLCPGVIASLITIHAGYGTGLGISFIGHLAGVRINGFKSLSR